MPFYPNDNELPIVISCASRYLPSIFIGEVPFTMVEFEFETPMYITDAEQTIVWSARTYNKYAYTIESTGKKTGASAKDVTITAGNIDRSVATIVTSETIQGKRATVWKSYWSASVGHTEPYILFEGLIDAVTIKEDENASSVAFTIKNDFTRWEASLPRHEFSGNCNWIFKSNTYGCQYTGTASLCNRTYLRCQKLNNLSHFRGFRHLPMMVEDHELWWGKGEPDPDAGD